MHRFKTAQDGSGLHRFKTAQEWLRTAHLHMPTMNSVCAPLDQALHALPAVLDLLPLSSAAGLCLCSAGLWMPVQNKKNKLCSDSLASNSIYLLPFLPFLPFLPSGTISSSAAPLLLTSASISCSSLASISCLSLASICCPCSGSFSVWPCSFSNSSEDAA